MTYLRTFERFFFCRGVLIRVPLVLSLVFFWISIRVLALDPPPIAVLHLSHGGYVAGELGSSKGSETVSWQSPSFVAPFEFTTTWVNAIQWPSPKKSPIPSGIHGFELAGGDLVYGSLIELSDNAAILELPRVGRVKVARSHLLRLNRWQDGSDLVYLGPNGMTDWREPPPPETTNPNGQVLINRPNPVPVPKLPGPPPKPSWREESGQILTDVPSSSIRGDVKLPVRASVDIELSWRTKPDFMLALGVGLDNSPSQACRFEVWDGDLVVSREVDDEADLAVVGKLANGPGRLQLKVYFDQESGKILVVSSDGKSPIELNVTGQSPQAFSGIRLDNLQGDLRLERLRIGRWNGESQVVVKNTDSRLSLMDGSTLDAESVTFSKEAAAFEVRKADSVTHVEAAKVIGIAFPSSLRESPRLVRAIYHDGTRLSGSLIKVGLGKLVMNVPGFDAELEIPLEGMRSFVFLQEEKPPLLPTDRVGTLELDQTKFKGRLISGHESAESSCLNWQPLGSVTSSSLRTGVAGRIVYKELTSPPIKPVAPQAVPVAQQPLAQRFLNGMIGRNGQNIPVVTANVRRALYLRDGDVIPCEIVKIDEQGVWFKTELSSSTFVPHAKVKGIIIAAAEPIAQIKLDVPKRERLLTLPRMQRDNPPTHLVRSRNGDYLRGRIVAMDDKTLKIEVRLEVKEVPRDRVARIIWLHSEEQNSAKAGDPQPLLGQTRVQAVKRDGVRFTFFAKQLTENLLSGVSDILGDCKITLDEVDQILIGPEIEKTANQLASQQLWKLTNAADPKTIETDGQNTSGGRPPGTESPLVGKSAPDFKLELLDGKTFQLAENKGKIVILDFWATWCGPCLQAMPQVERVADEFKDKNVLLIAVNLQESPKQIKAMLERHKFHPTVALDIDGVVAGRYAANAIPQTVIIDKEGKVTHLFVGGGPRFEDQLREALNSVIAPADPKKDP